MIPTHFLFQLADYEGIAIEWREMHHVQGIYTYTPEAQKPVIALSTTLHTNERKLRCVLAHELGHHFETAGNHLVAASGTRSIYATRNEHLATKWAVNLLMPTDVFLECIKGGMDAVGLSDFFHVLLSFVKFKSELIRQDEEKSEIVAELKASYSVVF